MASALPAATSPSLYATEPIGRTVNGAPSNRSHSPRLDSLRLPRTSEPSRAARVLIVAGCAVVGDAVAATADDGLVALWVEDAAGDGDAVLDVADRDTPLRYPEHELFGAVERVDDPHPARLEADEIVGGLFGEPPFAVSRQEPGGARR